MANDIRGWSGSKFSWHLSYGWGKTPEKPQPGKLTRPGIEPGPAMWEATMLPLDHSGGVNVNTQMRYCHRWSPHHNLLYIYNRHIIELSHVIKHQSSTWPVITAAILQHSHCHCEEGRGNFCWASRTIFPHSHPPPLFPSSLPFGSFRTFLVFIGKKITTPIMAYYRIAPFVSRRTPLTLPQVYREDVHGHVTSS